MITLQNLFNKAEESEYSEKALPFDLNEASSIIMDSLKTSPIVLIEGKPVSGKTSLAHQVIKAL